MNTTFVADAAQEITATSVAKMPRRVLLVSYLFPPTGGVGVLRVTKFTKYLAEFGWQPSILTVSNPSVPLFDESLCRDIPAGTIIRKARTLEPGYGLKGAIAQGQNTKKGGLLSSFKHGLWSLARRVGTFCLQPDPQILWTPFAVREGLRLLREIPHDVIMVSGPPFSGFLVGAKLARKTGLPLVLDYRDEWGISNAHWENKQQGWLSNVIQERLQRRVMRVAKLLLATTPSSAKSLGDGAARAGSLARSTHIYNGFDREDFPNPSGIPRSERTDHGNGTGLFRMLFIGTLWNLTSIEATIQGIESLAAKSPELVSHLELVIAGRRTGPQEALLDRLSKLPCRLVRLGFVDHSTAVRMMREADSLLMTIADLPGAERVISYKVYEYLAAGRPLFCVSPAGDLCDILRGAPDTIICDPNETEVLAGELQKLLVRHHDGADPGETSAASDWDVNRFERRTQTRQLAELFDSLVAK